MPREGPSRREKILRRLQEDLPFALDNSNWDSFNTWEFDPQRRTG
jgi:hypothetical protein